MKRFCIALAGAAVVAGAAIAGPAEDRAAFQKYFQQRFPSVEADAYVNGVYALDEASYQQWLQIEEFAPYELAIEEGKTLFETPFANGKTYADCFPNGGIGVRQNYPYFDTERGEVVTLELAINECRVKNGEEPLSYKKGAIASISAYMAYTSRGQKIDVKIPDDPRATAAYESGKEYYYSKRGQLNFSCADCHVTNAGMQIRADKLSPALGHPSHFPVYRSRARNTATSSIS